MKIFLTDDESTIDPYALDVEWLRQTGLFQEYSKRLADATYRKNRLESYLDRDIRANLKKYGFESKPTEAAIANTIQGNRGFLKRQYIYNRLSGDLKALQHKKNSLERLTDLFLAGYWAKPRIKSEAQDLYAQQIRSEMEDSLKADRRMLELAKERRENDN